jgi:hypothetical protein
MSRIAQLPEQEQEALAAILLREIESERSWDELFSCPESADLLASMADVPIRRRGDCLVDHSFGEVPDPCDTLLA